MGPVGTHNATTGDKANAGDGGGRDRPFDRTGYPTLPFLNSGAQYQSNKAARTPRADRAPPRGRSRRGEGNSQNPHGAGVMLLTGGKGVRGETSNRVAGVQRGSAGNFHVVSDPTRVPFSTGGRWLFQGTGRSDPGRGDGGGGKTWGRSVNCVFKRVLY